jgi:hypothetical protein
MGIALTAAAGLLALAWVRGSAGGAEVSGPRRIVLERPEVDLGVVSAREARVVEVPWRRVGPGEVRVFAVRTGCGCLEAEGLTGHVPSAARGTLRLSMAGRHDPGPFEAAVRVFTDASAPHDLLALRVRGYVGTSPVLRPAGLELGARSPGSRVTRRVELSVPPGHPTEPLVADLEGLGGEVRVEGPVLAGRAGVDLLVTVFVPRATGPFHGLLRVRVGDAPPVAARVGGLVPAPGAPETSAR